MATWQATAARRWASAFVDLDPAADYVLSAAGSHNKQHRFITSESPHIAFVGGRGSGKTYGGAIRAFRASYGYIGLDKVLPTPNLGMVTAPTYKLLQDGSLRAFREIAGGHIVQHNRSDNITRLRNGSEILWRSMDDPDKSVRGPTVSWWWGDEAAQYRNDARNLAVAMLRQFGTLGYEWLTTTPLGRNWLWQVYVQDHGDDAEYEVVQVSSFDNAYINIETIENFAADYHGDFREQEIEGAFVAYHGLIYANFRHAEHVVSSIPVIAARKEVIAGVDWGFASPGVILVIAVDYDGKAWVIHEEYVERRKVDDWTRVAEMLRARYAIEIFYCDSSQPEFIDKFRQAGLTAWGATHDVVTGIQAVYKRIDTRQLVVSRECQNTIREFGTYQWRIDKGSENLLDMPIKLDDHAMDALRYAIYSHDRGNIYGQSSAISTRR